MLFICNFSFYKYNYLSLSLGSIGPFSFRILSSITGMSLISWFSLSSLGVKIFLLISSYSTSVSHSFVLMTLAWTSLCSAISKFFISLLIAIIRFWYTPLIVHSFGRCISSPVCLLLPSNSFSPPFQPRDLFPLPFPHALLSYLSL